MVNIDVNKSVNYNLTLNIQKGHYTSVTASTAQQIFSNFYRYLNGGAAKSKTIKAIVTLPYIDFHGIGM